jgi:hypothetical protein
MALTTFHFEASLPAEADFLDVLGALVEHALVYVGEEQHDAASTASGLARAVVTGMAGQGHVHVRLDRNGDGLVIRLAGANLPAKPPPAGLLDEATVSREGSETVYRLLRRLPAS